MLVGQPPFTGRTVQMVLARHRQEAPPPMRVVRPALPEEIEQIVETALAKVPADRFGSAQEFAAALGEPTQSRPRISAAIPGRRRRSGIAAASGLAALVGAA